MVSSSAYPDLDRSPKKNWVESAGGLPSYIERIAKHIHYEGGKDISTAISMAISQVKRWATGGGGVSAKTQALAAKAVAQWEALKGKSKARAVAMSARRIAVDVLELSIVEDKTGRPPKPLKAEEIARLRAKVLAGTATAADRARLKKLREGREKQVQLARRGPYQRHVRHTKQFGKQKGDLSKPADWQHPYQPKTQTAGALKAKHIDKSDLDSSGKPKPGKSDEVKKPLPASAALHGVGRKEQHTGDENTKSAPGKVESKSVEKAPSAAVLRAQRRRLQAKLTAGTATTAEKATLNRIITQLKKVMAS